MGEVLFYDSNFDKYFTDYEECLEQCLLKALKHYTI